MSRFGTTVDANALKGPGIVSVAILHIWSSFAQGERRGVEMGEELVAAQQELRLCSRDPRIDIQLRAVAADDDLTGLVRELHSEPERVRALTASLRRGEAVRDLRAELALRASKAASEAQVAASVARLEAAFQASRRGVGEWSVP